MTINESAELFLRQIKPMPTGATRDIILAAYKNGWYDCEIERLKAELKLPDPIEQALKIVNPKYL